MAADTGRAFWTTTTISSPTEPHPLVTLFLRTLTHSTMRAPELSMTCRIWSLLRQTSRMEGGSYIKCTFKANHGYENEKGDVKDDEAASNIFVAVLTVSNGATSDEERGQCSQESKASDETPPQFYFILLATTTSSR